MRKFTLLLLIAALSMNFGFSQKTRLVIPQGVSMEKVKNTPTGVINPERVTDADLVVMPDVNPAFLKSEENKKDGTRTEVGRSIPLNLDMNNSGTWYSNGNGEESWILRIKVGNALAMALEIKNLFIPIGSRMFIYDSKGHVIHGPYTYKDNPENGIFPTDITPYDEIVIEYIKTPLTKAEPQMLLDEVVYFYRDIQITSTTKDSWHGFGDSESCQININCTQGANWQTQKKGVAQITLKVGTSYAFCTGSLINNTAQDCKKYFLTAFHCYEGASTSDLTQWRFYFNYEAPTCTNPTTDPTNHYLVTGSTLKATGDISGGSDFCLLELTGAIQSAWGLYMNGWDRATTAPTGGVVGIHHPAGDIQKISICNTTVSSTTWTGGATGGHWYLIWGSGNGSTEGGSSGSPLFNSAGKIVGTLTGGGSCCVANGCGQTGSGPNNPDAYGKMSFHWNNAANGTGSTHQLQPWLDPSSTGVTTLGGMTCPSTTTINADFAGTPTTVNVGQTVTFTNLSTGGPTTYSWNFGANASPATATTAGPHSVTYSATGLKTVTLTVSGTSGSDTETKTNYINVTIPGTTCDTLVPASIESGTCDLYLYYADNVAPYDSGWLCGQNAYLDKEKAMLYSGTPGGTVQDVFVLYGYKRGTTGNTSVKIYTSNAGAPGTVSGTSATIAKSAIDTTGGGGNFNNKYHFSSPITVGADFFVSAVLPTGFTTGTNELSILAADYNCSSTATLAYEMWSDNSWNSFTDIYGVNIDICIFPILCPTGVNIDDVYNPYINIFPNPAGKEVFVLMPYPDGEPVSISIIDVCGKVFKTQTVFGSSSPVAVELGDLPNGVYMIQGETSYSTFVKRITVINK